jgi:glycosyltransferase involved in cell wall biosynthesis
MEDMPKFSVVIRLDQTVEMFFRDCLESLVAQTYEEWELYVLDSNDGDQYGRIVSEFFPGDDRVHYRPVKKDTKLAYALNTGFRFALTDAARLGVGNGVEDSIPWYLFIVQQHDRLASNALQVMAEQVTAAIEQERRPSIIYSDHDELVGVDRMNPHFKTALNREWLRRCNYIGESFAVSVEVARHLGEFQEKLVYASIYDYLLRAMERGETFLHIPALLYHKRILVMEDRKAKKQMQEKTLWEHMVAAQASLKRQELAGEVEKAVDDTYWKVKYNGEEALQFQTQKEYLFLHDDSVRPLTRHNAERMYGYLKQKDVAVVGARFLKNGFHVDNCGYIYDTQGQVFPAFYDQKAYRPTYENLGHIPRDVSMVDFGYCMISEKAYRRLHGFDAALTGRDLMLDFCLRARQAGYRIVIDPTIVVRRTAKVLDSEESSRQHLLEKWGEELLKGDPFYNANLPCDLENYRVV